MNQTTKAACNTSVDAALLAEAKSLNISPSVVLEQALRKAVSQAKAELWQAENADAIAAYNQQCALRLALVGCCKQKKSSIPHI